MDENREERFYDLLEADENDAEAQYQIGLCYLNGDGTDKDTQKAETYFRRASELGHAAAAEMLGKDSIADQSPNTENVSLPELCPARRGRGCGCTVCGGNAVSGG